ncbi:HMG-box domain-containing protein [Aspergillus mulundensis]|uniref:HMG box protein, putative (JCVI) n=1 Tax=Aspergillus mulundensis TaxID=1810919 RepID=A0A3D8T6Q7_9EURO|nr:HMG box protein, putative (JCVI) [Aspergillus mulundensis]RDW94121.1 HMG box protein, putative (JCVI) [Aspergillus mulundensis]
MQQQLLRNPPPSPPHSNDGDLASDADLYSMYGTPEPYAGGGQGGDESFSEQSSVGINIRYAPTSDYPQNASLHHSMMHNGARVSTPPTDDSFAPGSLDSTASTRWSSPGRRQSAARARVLRSPKQRRRAKNRSNTESTYAFKEPLSILTAQLTHIEVKDMDKHVNRPIEERLIEVQKKDGKIPRPMNSFMLYRSAYAERVKEFFRQQNHQVVSSASGVSWNKETPEIRAKYERLAVIEKRNHLKAHPGYKFTPTKDKRKRGTLDDTRSFNSEFGGTSDGSPASRHISRLSTFSTPEISSGWNSGHPTPPDMGDHGLPTDYGFPPTWPTSHPARPTSGMMLTSDPSHFIQHAPHPEEIHYAPSTALAGLPGAAHHDLLQPQGQPGGQVDPALLDYPNSSLHPEGGNHAYGHPHYPVWQESGTNAYAPFEASMAPSPNGLSGAQPMQQSVDGQETWESGQAATLEPAGGEFDSWLNHPNGY